MLAALVPLFLAAWGASVVAVLLRRHGWSWEAAWPYGLVLGPGVGLGLGSLGFFFWVFAGFHPPGRWVLLGLIAVLSLILAGPVHRRLDAGVEPLFEWLRWVRRPWRRPTVVELVAGLLVIITLGMIVATFPTSRVSQPFGFYDAVAIWNARSFFLFRSTGNLSEIYADLRFGHPDYPLFLPGTLAAQYSLFGQEHVAIPQVTGLLFALSCCAAVFLLVARYGSLAVAGSAAALLAVTPSFWRWLFAQYADLPLAYLLVIGVIVLASQLEEPSRRLPATLTGFCFGLLTWIKNEGLVLALLLGASLIIVIFVTRDFRVSWARRGFWGLVGGLPVFAALGLFKAFWSPINETGMFLEGALAKILTLDRWWIIAQAFLEELNPWSGMARWGLLWPFILVCGAVFWRQRLAVGRPFLFVSLAMASGWAVWFAIYLCTPASLEWHLDSSLKRLLLQLAPLTLGWSLLGVGRAESEGQP